MKDIILGQGNDPCKGVDLDAALNFECGYEMFSCSEDQPKFQSENGGLDCLVLENPLSIMESSNQIETTLEVFQPNLESHIKPLCFCLSNYFCCSFQI